MARRVLKAEKFYKAIMKLHDRRSTAYVPEEPQEKQTGAPATPSKSPKPKPRPPAVPSEKDGSINKARMRKMAGVGKWCSTCKAVKRGCPGPEGSNCEVWDIFTDEEPEEDEPKQDEPEEDPLDEIQVS